MDELQAPGHDSSGQPVRNTRLASRVPERRADVMGNFAPGIWLKRFGWLATADIAAAAVGAFLVRGD